MYRSFGNIWKDFKFKFSSFSIKTVPVSKKNLRKTTEIFTERSVERNPLIYQNSVEKPIVNENLS
jgi:hypothetical protein